MFLNCTTNYFKITFSSYFSADGDSDSMSDYRIISPTITDIPGLNEPSKVNINGLSAHLAPTTNINERFTNQNLHNGHYSNSNHMSSSSTSSSSSRSYKHPANHSHENGSEIMVNGGGATNKNSYSNYNRNQQSFTKIQVNFIYFQK